MSSCYLHCMAFLLKKKKKPIERLICTSICIENLVLLFVNIYSSRRIFIFKRRKLHPHFFTSSQLSLHKWFLFLYKKTDTIPNTRVLILKKEKKKEKEKEYTHETCHLYENNSCGPMFIYFLLQMWTYVYCLLLFHESLGFGIVLQNSLSSNLLILFSFYFILLYKI